MDFLEELDELADAAEASSFYDNEGGGGRAGCSGQELDRRKRSFKVAGDMSTALKLFHQHALPANDDRGDEDGADMLAVILEFFLELCDEGQAGALAFFCPQVCHVHLQMLPATGARQLARAEMVEDFLLTVSARHSVSLALGLSWGLAADLEESLGEGRCGAAARRRRFTFPRFACELESVLFGFDGRWGGSGGGRMLVLGQHQAVLLCDAVAQLQLRRRFAPGRLTRSAQLDLLRDGALEALGEAPVPGCVARAPRRGAALTTSRPS